MCYGPQSVLLLIRCRQRCHLVGSHQALRYARGQDASRRPVQQTCIKPYRDACCSSSMTVPQWVEATTRRPLLTGCRSNVLTAQMLARSGASCKCKAHSLTDISVSVVILSDRARFLLSARLRRQRLLVPSSDEVVRCCRGMLIVWLL